MIATLGDDATSVQSAHEFARAALALVRAVRHDAPEEELLRQCMALLTQRLAGVRWAVHVRDTTRKEWRLVGHHGIGTADVTELARPTAGPGPLGDSQSWSTWRAIPLDVAPWAGLSHALIGKCLIMPVTFMDGEIAGSITVFAGPSAPLLAALEDAATLIWAMRTRRRHELIIGTHTGQYAALAEFSPDVILRLDTDHRIAYVNRAFERATTTRSQPVIGLHVLDCVAPSARDLFHSALRMINGPRGRAEFVYTVDDRRFAARLAPELDAHERVVGSVVTIRDVTEPFRLEQERQAAEIRCEVISEVARSVIYERRLSDETAYVSPSIAKVFGHSPEEAARGGLAWWLDRIHPEDRARCARMFAGTDGIPESQWSAEFRVKKSDGTWATVLDQGRLLERTDHAPARTVGALTDITALRALQSQLHHAHRVELIGRLAGGVAHDFNNVLAAIGSFTELLLADTPSSDPRSKDLREISGLVQRASALTQNLLGLSRRREHAQPAVLSVAASIARLAPTLRTLLGSGVELTIESIAPTLKVLIDPGHLDQIVLNLAVNARDAMPDGGAVVVRASLEEPGDQAPAQFVRIDVVDRGFGISPDVLKQVFEPYFTTKPEGHGTGLGLSVVHDIVKTAGGQISAESSPGAGTTFSVRFPLAGGRLTPESVEIVVENPVENGTVLLIEDEESVRRSTRRILERNGFHVLEARTGDTGLAMLYAHRETIDVVVTDLYMPGLFGPDLVERLRESAPEIGCLVISGHAERFAKLKPEPGLLVVQSKPCRAAQLISHIVVLGAASAERKHARSGIKRYS